MNYDLVRPCAKCPFRMDVEGYLRRGRAQEIARSLSHGAEFACHKTTVDDGDDGLKSDSSSQFCAGALIMLEHEEQPNQMMRIAERTNFYDPTKLDMSAPVAKTRDEFILHHGEGDEAAEPCGVAEMNCLAPAGWMDAGSVTTNHDIDPEEVKYCYVCGTACCSACGEDDDEGRKCGYCLETA